MTDVTPEGTLALSLSYLRNTVAGSETFQELTGAADQAAAKAHVYYHSLEDEDVARPFAVVRFWNDEDGERESNSGYNFNGSMIVEIELEIPSEYRHDFQNAYMWLLNQLGLIRDEMLTLSRTASLANGYASFERLTMGPHGIIDPTEKRDQLVGTGSWVVQVRTTS